MRSHHVETILKRTRRKSIWKICWTVDSNRAVWMRLIGRTNHCQRISLPIRTKIRRVKILTSREIHSSIRIRYDILPNSNVFWSMVKSCWIKFYLHFIKCRNRLQKILLTAFFSTKIGIFATKIQTCSVAGCCPISMSSIMCHYSS